MFQPPIGVGPEGELLEGPSAFGGEGTNRLVVDRHLNHFNIYETPDAAPAGRVAQQAAAARRDDSPRHPGDDLIRSAPLLRRERRGQLVDRLVLPVARADRARRDARRGAGSRLRRDRPPGVPRRRNPRRAPPDGGRRHRAALGANRRHVRRGLRARRPPDGGLRPRLPGRPARTDQRRLHDQALPGRWPPGRRRGSSFPVRQGSGLSRRALRGSPAALRVGLRRRDRAGHALLRPPGRHGARAGRLRLQPTGDHRAAPRAASASTASCAPTGPSSATCRCPTGRCGRRRPGASKSSSAADRLWRIIEAGCDQLGGEHLPELLVQLVEEGRVSEARIDESARRILRDKFRLGLFDDPYVDAAAAETICGRPEFREAGAEAQRRAIVLLSNNGVLPLRSGARLFVDGLPDGSRGRLRLRRRAPGRRRRGDRLSARALRAAPGHVHRVALPCRQPRVPDGRA